MAQVRHAILILKNNSINLESNNSYFIRLTCDSNGSFTQSLEHANAVFLPGMFPLFE